MNDIPKDLPPDVIPVLTPEWAKEHEAPTPWRDNGARTIYDTPWLAVTEHDAVAPTGSKATYSVARFKNLAAGVLPIHDDGTVALVGQSRFARMNYSWEMPEGGVPAGEDPLAGIQRELAEEAGLQAGSWLEVLRMELSNSVTDEQAVAWLAWDLTPAPVDPDPTEVIATARVPFKDLLHEIHRGAIRDAFTIATALRAYHMAHEGLLPPRLAALLTGRK